jgi:hypothetical protein
MRVLPIQLLAANQCSVFCDEDVALFNGGEAQYRFVRKPTVTRPKKSEQLAQLMVTVTFRKAIGSI